jgi:hypothetical protein
MADSNTPQAEATLRENGILTGFTEPYIRVPDFITQDPALDARHYYLYGVILKYVQIGTLTGKGAFPSKDVLAEECGVTDDTITGWLKTLKESGWIDWKRRPNASSIFHIFGPDDRVIGNRDSRFPETEDSGMSNKNSSNKNSKEESKSPSYSPTESAGVEQGSPEPRERVEEVSVESEELRHEKSEKQWAHLGHQPPSRNGTPSETARVSNSSERSTEEALPFWQENPKHLLFIGAMVKVWPKPVNQHLAMIAWREVVGTRPNDDTTMSKRIWYGMQWWLRYWEEKKTDEKYIPNLENWIRKERWADAQVAEEYLEG